MKDLIAEDERFFQSERSSNKSICLETSKNCVLLSF